MTDDISKPDTAGKFVYLQFEIDLEDFSKELLIELTHPKPTFPVLHTSHFGGTSIVEDNSISLSQHLVPLPHINLDRMRLSQLKEINNLLQKHMMKNIEDLARKNLMGDELKDEHGK